MEGKELIIQPADRLANVSEYYLQKKMKEVADMNRLGLDVVSLGIGGPDMPPPADAITTLCDVAKLSDSHGYQPGNGLDEMREAFAKWYRQKYNVEVDAHTELMPLIGSKEGILHVSLTFLNPGDGVLVPNPGYPTYTSVSKIVGARTIDYNLLPENGWQPDFDALEKMDLSGVKLMWVNYPNMPTGGCASISLFRKILDFGKKHNIVIAHDNPYSFILNEKPLSILSLPGAKDIAIEMNSLSKSHNMAGWRIGVLASNKTFVGWIRKIKSNVDSGQFKPVMQAVVKALSADVSWYKDINALYKERRQIAEKIATALGCTFDPSQRGMFLWCRIADTEASGEELANRLLEQARVFITPGFIFGSNGDRYVRISLCAKPHRMVEALDRINRLNNLK